MAAFDFPNSPSNGDTYSANGMTFTWNGTMWKRTSPSVGAQGATGPTGSTGAQGATAAAGAQGAQGHQGATGGTGATGAQGATGSTGAQGATGPTGAQGSTGSTGAQGAEGNFGGATFYYTFETNTTNANPGAGDIRLDNSTQNAATGIYICDTDEDGTDIASYLQTIDDSTSTIKGHVKITNKLDSSQFILFTISSLTDNTGYFDITVSPVDSSATSPFSANEDILITFARTGDKGDTGATGAQGATAAAGAQGATGSTGAQGAAGAQGAQGHQGATGGTGAQGTTGSTGAQGATGASGSATLSNNADNRVITGGSGTNLNGEASLTFDGSTLVQGSNNDSKIVLTGADNPYIRFRNSSDTNRGYIQMHSNGNMYLVNQVTSESLKIGSGAGGLTFTHDGSERVIAHQGYLTNDIWYLESGKSYVGNFGQFQGHATYTDFNTEPAYWGWNYVQGNTNAPNTIASQWYRGRFSLGSGYGKGSDSGDYSIEIAMPRQSYNTTAGQMYIRTIEAGSEQTWREVGTRPNGSIVPGQNNTQNIGDGSNNFNSIWASTRFRGNDDVKLVLGNSQDLVIRHDGNNNLIESPQGGNLYIKSGTGDNANINLARFNHAGSAYLYYNSNLRLTTTSTGVDIDGTTDGVLNIDTTDGRGAFIRLQQSGNTKVWVGSSEGFGVGDQDDGALMAVDQIHLMSSQTRRITINGGGMAEIYGGGSSTPWGATFRAADSNNSTRVFFEGINGQSNRTFSIMSEQGKLRVSGNGTAGTSTGSQLVYLSSTSSTSWSSGSDIRLKENVTEIPNVLDKVKNYRCARFNFIGDDASDIQNIKFGFIAQDWVDDFPEVLSTSTQDADDPTDTTEYYGMQYTETIPVLLKAIQELNTKVETLQNEVNTLKSS